MEIHMSGFEIAGLLFIFGLFFRLGALVVDVAYGLIVSRIEYRQQLKWLEQAEQRELPLPNYPGELPA